MFAQSFLVDACVICGEDAKTVDIIGVTGHAGTVAVPVVYFYCMKDNLYPGT